MLSYKTILAFNPSVDVFIMPINVKMPTRVGILIFMSIIISCSFEKKFNYLRLGLAKIIFLINRYL